MTTPAIDLSGADAQWTIVKGYDFNGILEIGTETTIDDPTTFDPFDITNLTYTAVIRACDGQLIPAVCTILDGPNGVLRVSLAKEQTQMFDSGQVGICIAMEGQPIINGTINVNQPGRIDCDAC